MIDDETVTNDTEDYTPDPEPAPAPEPEPTPAPAPDPAPEPEEAAAPVEVITVDDLLDRLTQGSQDETEAVEEQPPENESEESDEAPFGLPEAIIDGGPIEIVGMDTALKCLETIQKTVDHPAMTTPFEDYTVTEALLLLLFLAAFIAACVKMLKGGFAWLR